MHSLEMPFTTNINKNQNFPHKLTQIYGIKEKYQRSDVCSMKMKTLKGFSVYLKNKEMLFVISEFVPYTFSSGEV